MKKRLGWLVFASALALGAAPALRADEAPVPSARFDVERLRRHLEQLHERARSAASAAPSGSSLPAVPPSSSATPFPLQRSAEELARKWAELAATRHERREQHRATLFRQLGARLNDPEVAAELKVHATRLAELSRIEFLAQNARQGAAREQLLARVAKLSARESERHRRRLARLTAASPAASASSAPAPRPSSEG